MLTLKKVKAFANGHVFLLETEDGYPIETTETFLPYYTKDAIGRNQNSLDNNDLGSREERFMIGISVSSGCPVRCKFCATGKLKRWRNLTADEIIDQVFFVYEWLYENGHTKGYTEAPKEFKINYTRMGDFSLNIDEVRKAIFALDLSFKNDCDVKIHHYLSTIGIKGVDYSWLKPNMTLQFSVHSFDEEHRDWLIPYPNKMSLEEMGAVRTKSDLKTTVNLTLVEESDFDIEGLKKYFDPEHFFVKLSPLNKNSISDGNGLEGVIHAVNLA